MKFTLVFLITLSISPIILFGQDNKKQTLGEFIALQEANKIIEKEKKENKYDTLYKSEESAIKYAEPILFKAYGKSQILREKPYISNLTEGIWTIKGTLHSKKGGTFLFSFHSVDGKVIKLTHGK